MQFTIYTIRNTDSVCTSVDSHTISDLWCELNKITRSDSRS